MDPSNPMQNPEHLHLVVEAAPIAIVVADAEGRITLINAQGERLFGYDREELLGAPVEMLVPERFRSGHGLLRAGFHRAPSARAMGAGRDLFGLRKDGAEVPIEIGLNPLSTPQGEFVLASVIDITERKQAEELRLQRDRAVDASQFKTQFVATMSHELRTPLTAIIGAAELLSAMNLDQRQRACVETIDESAGALLSTVSSILDFSKIEAGKIDLETRNFELDATVAKASAVLAPQARDKGLTLHTYVDPAIPPTLRGDQDRLRQILLNLIGNAVKFTSRGHVVVRALSVETSSRYERVRFEVQDTGIGIDEETLQRLFEPFVQADPSSSRMHGGTGLGLSICKRLVELMDGAIGVTSEPGNGSLFWFTAQFGRPSVAQSSRHVYGVRALVVSSDEFFADIVSRYVESWGIPARRVLDAGQVTDAVRGSTTEDREDDAVDWIAVVDVDDEATAAAMDVLRASPLFVPHRVIAAGRNERLTTPIGQSALFERITEALGDVSPSPPQSPAVPGDAPGRAGTVLVVEDNARIKEILVQQITALGFASKTVSDGAEAVEAVLRERFSLVFMDCHMPKMDGLEATRAIRAAESTRGGHVPIVAMTANAFKEDREACLAAGMDDYLSKPLRMNDLRAMMQRWTGTAAGGAPGPESG
jgi:PAS domain S-box-containing protein